MVEVGSSRIVLAIEAATVSGDELTGGVVFMIILAGAAKYWVKNEKLSAKFKSHLLGLGL